MPQLPHAPTQSTGHKGELHDCDAVVPLLVEQATPPFATAVVTMNVRDWLPLPHVVEHVPQLPHAPTQSTGHKAVLHDCDAVIPPVVEQATPPFLTAVVTVNVRD